MPNLFREGMHMGKEAEKTKETGKKRTVRAA